MDTTQRNYPCRHCGKAESCHLVTAPNRSSDQRAQEGYTTPLAECSGFEQKKCQRNQSGHSHYKGIDRRISSYNLNMNMVEAFLQTLKLPVAEKQLPPYPGENRRR